MSDFSKIYSSWEKMQKGKFGKLDSLPEDWLDRYPPDGSKKEITEKSNYHPGEIRQRKRNLPYQRTLDLHGFTVDEARLKLCRFIADCSAAGIEKVLIIHGKGIHSKRGSKIPEMVHECLRNLSDVGETSNPDRKDGGSGATWALLK
jgi:DNA-nicking Smr family endonuclease